MEKRFFNGWRIGLIGVFAFSILLYLPSLLGGSIWDDDDLLKGSAIGGGSLIGAFTKPFLGHYFRPLTSVSFVIDNVYAHNTPFYYHQTNILLHAATAVIVCCLALVLTGSRLAGILTGLFFATQPMQVGATAWIGGRTDVLSAFFVALFLVCLVLYHKSQKMVWLVLSTATFLFAALSKEQALAIYPAVPLSVFVFGSKKWKDATKLSIPFAIAVVVYLGTWAVLLPAPATSPFTFFHSLRLFTLTAAHYSLAVLTPNKTSLMTFTLENYRSPLWLLVGALFIAAFLVAVWKGWKYHRPLVWILICGFLVYLPIGNFPPVPSFLIGPYRLAEAGTCFACLFGIVGAYLISRRRYFLSGILAANLVAGALVSWAGIHLWLKPFDLFKTIAETDPHFMVGVGNYSHTLDLDNRSPEAMKWTDSTLKWLFGTQDWIGLLEKEHAKAITPPVVDRLLTNAGGENTKVLGWFIGCYAASLTILKRYPEARAVEKEAVIIAPRDARLNFGYGELLLDVDRRQAIHYFEVAIKLNSGYTACAIALAHEYLKDKRYADTVNLLVPAMEKAEWNTEAWLDLVDAQIALHNYPGAQKALAGADAGLFPAKDKIALRRKRLRELMAKPASAN